MTNRYLLSYTFLLLFLLNSLSSVAQFSGVKWEQKILVYEGQRSGNPPLESILNAVSNDKNEVFIIGRVDREYGVETWGSLVRKLNSNGQLMWTAGVGTYFFNAVTEAVYTDIIPSNDGGAFVLTVTKYHEVDIENLNGTDETKADIDLSRFSSDGTLLWHKYFGGTRFDFPSSFISDRFGNIVIAGQTSSSNYEFSGKLKYVDTNSYAYKTWGSIGDTTFNLSDTFRLSEIAKYQKMNDAFIMKISPSGQFINVKCFGGSSTDKFSHIIEHPVSGYVAIGHSESKDGDLPQEGTKGGLWMLRLDTALNILTKKIIDTATVTGKPHFFIKRRNLYFSNSSSLMKIDLEGNIIAEYNTNGLQIDSKCYFDPLGNVFSAAGESIKICDSTFQIVDSLKFQGWKYGYKDAIVNGTNLNNLVFLTKRPLLEYTEEAGPDEFFRFYYSYGVLNFAKQYNKVLGNIFVDNNMNNAKDSNEPHIKGINVEARKGSYFLTAISGTLNGFLLPLDSGKFTISISTPLPYYSSSPNSAMVQFSGFDEIDNINFALQPIANKKDLSINLLPLNIARPGFPVQYQLICTNKGTETISNVQVKFLRHPRVNFVSSTPVVNTTIGDTLIWNIASLKPFDTSYINLDLRIAAPPTVNFNDTLLFKAFAYPVVNDETPGDNQTTLVQQVQGSYDPNDKTETHGGIITPEQLAGNEFLTYLIRFQNTGTDTAFNVMIRDTLTNKLDWSSFETLSSSHPYQLYIVKPHILEFSFPNILLVDSNKNERASHGFIAYRIKPKSNLSIGDTVLNRAHIYFDYNLPVITNDELTVLRNTVITSVLDLSRPDNELFLYPNPANGLVNITRKGRLAGTASLSITDMNGRVVYLHDFGRISVEQFNQTVDISGFSKGLYVVKLQLGKQPFISKFILQ